MMQNGGSKEKNENSMIESQMSRQKKKYIVLDDYQPAA